MRNKIHDPFTDDFFELEDGRTILIMKAFLKKGTPTLTICLMLDKPCKETVDVFDLTLDAWREAMDNYASE